MHFFKILIFWVVMEVKGQKCSKMTKSFVCCTPYLKNHTSYDCIVIYGKHLSNDNIFKCFFFHFSFLFSGSIGKKQSIMINCLSHSISQENHTSYDCDFWCTCVKMMISPANFFIF